MTLHGSRVFICAVALFFIYSGNFFLYTTTVLVRGVDIQTLADAISLVSEDLGKCLNFLLSQTVVVRYISLFFIDI